MKLPNTSCQIQHTSPWSYRMMSLTWMMFIMVLMTAFIVGQKTMANEPGPTQGSDPALVEEGLNLVPLDDESQAAADAQRERENPTHHCDKLPDAFQRSCCHRAERLKELQEQEFAFKDSNGVSLYDLQQNHDQKLAELTLLEGVDRLQKDYLDFMESLHKKPQPEGHPLRELAKLEEDLNKGVDTIHRLKYLHDTMDLLKSDVGFDLTASFDKNNSEQIDSLYERVVGHCADKTQGICELLNPNSQHNKNAPRSERLKEDDFKEMLSAYMEIYSVASESREVETPVQYRARVNDLNNRLVSKLERIPLSVVSNQISSYQESRENIRRKFDVQGGAEEAQRVRTLYKCVEQMRYDNQVASCGNLPTTLLNTANTLNREILESQQEILSSITDLPESLKMHLEKMGTQRSHLTHQLSEQTNPVFDQRTLINLKNDIENRLGLASHIYHSRPEKAEDFFGDFEEMNTSDKEKFMMALCAGKDDVAEFGTKGFHQCLEGLTQDKYRFVNERKNQLQADVQRLKASLDSVKDSEAFKGLNSFKNFLGSQIQRQCGKSQSSPVGTTIQGCVTNIEEDVTLAKFVDLAGKVVAEVEFSTTGKDFTTEKVIEMFQFCNAHATPAQRQAFAIECEYVNENYRLMTTRYDKIDDDLKEWSRENMNVYDPVTDSVSTVRRRSTGAMIGLGAARALTSSIPTFMQYQQTKHSLPFMRDQAMAQKQFAFWNNQYFNAQFARPGLNPFGMGGFGGYQVGFNNFGGFSGFGGVRSPIAPQSYSIP